MNLERYLHTCTLADARSVYVEDVKLSGEKCPAKTTQEGPAKKKSAGSQYQSSRAEEAPAICTEADDVPRKFWSSACGIGKYI